MNTWSFYATKLLSSWKKSDKYRNELPYELSFLLLLIYSRTAASYLNLLSRTCLVNNVSRLASQICLGVSYRFFIAAVCSIEILPQFYLFIYFIYFLTTAWFFLFQWKESRPTIECAIKQCTRQQRTYHQATDQSASKVQNRQHQKTNKY